MQARDRRYHSNRRANRRLNRKRNSLIGFGFMGLVLLLSHQNCAPADLAEGSSAPSGIVTEAPLPVTIIDESKKVSGLSFPYGEIELADNAGTVNLLGNCSESQEDSVLGWKLNEVSEDGSPGALIDQGQAVCLDRHFSVQAVTSGLACGRNYKAVAQLGFGEPGEVVLHKPCK